MYQFDFVAIGIGHKGNHGAAAFDGAGLPGDLASGGANFFASGVGIGHAQGNVAVGGAQVVVVGAPVVGQLQFGLGRIAAAKA